MSLYIKNTTLLSSDIKFISQDQKQHKKGGVAIYLFPREATGNHKSCSPVYNLEKHDDISICCTPLTLQGYGRD